MRYPMQFILPAYTYKNVSIHSEDFPQDIDKQLTFCGKRHCFSTVISLPPGTYHYQFDADGVLIPDTLRTISSGFATIHIGSTDNNGIIFDIDKSFVKNKHLVLLIGLDCTVWKNAILNIQTLQGMQTIHGHSTFIEGSFDYQMFVIDITQEESLFAFFELIGYANNCFFGANGIKQTEWAIEPFEIKEHLFPPIPPSDIVGIYHLSNKKSVADFEKHNSYFTKFPIDYISGNIPENSLLKKEFNQFTNFQNILPLTCLLRDIFLETEDFNPSLGLLGRFAYEHRQDMAEISFSLSDDFVSFWDLTKRNFKVAARGIGFQLLGSMTPLIYFGEEIGLRKTGEDRNMLWTKIKWNKDLYNFYQKLLKLRIKYPVLRQGRFRLILQDCCLWGIERYMDGEDSIYIFANHSKNNIIIDLTQIISYSGPIIELLSNHSLKRKKVCTIFGESLVAFKSNKSKSKIICIEQEDDEE